MSITTITHVRKPLYVEAVQVTEENFAELALWCQGKITEPPSEKPHERHIHLQVANPMNPRQAQARVGDWILTSDQGYKVYTPKAFAKTFDVAKVKVEVESGLFASTVASPQNLKSPEQETSDREAERIRAELAGESVHMAAENILYPEGHVLPVTGDALEEGDAGHDHT